MDKLDARILDLLQGNGGLAAAEIADSCGLVQGAVLAADPEAARARE